MYFHKILITRWQTNISFPSFFFSSFCHSHIFNDSKFDILYFKEYNYLYYYLNRQMQKQFENQPLSNIPEVKGHTDVDFLYFFPYNFHIKNFNT